MPLERVGTGWSAAIAAWLLFAAAALAPFPFGSVTPPAIAFWCIVLGACPVFAPVRPLGAGQLGLIVLAAVLVAAYALVVSKLVAATATSFGTLINVLANVA